jgi:hypothetical protein
MDHDGYDTMPPCRGFIGFALNVEMSERSISTGNARCLYACGHTFLPPVIAKPERIICQRVKGRQQKEVL